MSYVLFGADGSRVFVLVSWLCFADLLPAPHFSISSLIHQGISPQTFQTPVNRLISSISYFCVNQINTEYETSPTPIERTSAGGTAAAIPVPRMPYLRVNG